MSIVAHSLAHSIAVTKSTVLLTLTVKNAILTCLYNVKFKQNSAKVVLVIAGKELFTCSLVRIKTRFCKKVKSNTYQLQHKRKSKNRQTFTQKLNVFVNGSVADLKPKSGFFL